MKPVYQTRFGGADAPEEQQGNCMQAALASAFELELDEAPDFTGHIVNGKWYEILQSWLAERNMVLIPMGVGGGHPPGIHLMACKSTTLPNPDDGHVVVIQDGNVIHNPRMGSRDTRIERCAISKADPPTSGQKGGANSH